ncbi:MAG: UDP-N-acetylmuramoyl-L-alanyl-D-glutamate--2,6-diaminopimelate ligase [Clostridia bacterium]|nr:UDP-N-acetylmuramoyl-L-alanyl-D-glutamate--2,6-diaminopimelate ligase [Clostridia bacterium]MDD4686306.1 UDP-N-acetylmuramoyl-L-alanyl-D-glutamate--2,6-diaminopimelate ligase [Clostridia bacterium]
MQLLDLLKGTQTKKIVGNINNVDISNISISSKDTKDNGLFIAQKGIDSDGHDYAIEAVKNGATALVVERELDNVDVPQIITPNSRLACADLASNFYDNPKDKLKIVGITGTNGKTSTSFFLADMLKQANKKTAVIGTLGVFLDDKNYETDLTTPDPLKLHKILDFLVKKNVEYVVMEVSAHALALNKLDNINFEAGILTNISQDHLDYFKTMDNYAITKLNWFLQGNIKYAIINADDDYSKPLLKRYLNEKFKKQLLEKINVDDISGKPLLKFLEDNSPEYFSEKYPLLLCYGLDNPSDVFALNINKSSNNTKFIVNLFNNVLQCKTNLVGEFNVYNVISAQTAALCLGVNIGDIMLATGKLKAPTGRFNVIELEKNKNVVVDFAHTPDSLEEALNTAREVCKGRLISVFGCGGNRDKTKRPIMGSISEKIADLSIITSDNPRFENPNDIIDEIATGFTNSNYIKIANRKQAIKKGLSLMEPNDMVLISGKGGELYQDIKGVKYPYNDFDEINKFKKNYCAENILSK